MYPAKCTPDGFIHPKWEPLIAATQIYRFYNFQQCMTQISKRQMYIQVVTQLPEYLFQALVEYKHVLPSLGL